MLTITANAKKYLEEKLKREGHKYAGLSLKPSGCAGFEYVWDYADEDHNGRVVADLVVVEENAEGEADETPEEVNDEPSEVADAAEEEPEDSSGVEEAADEEDKKED